MQELSYERLKTQVAGRPAAIRRITTLYPAGGHSEKVFPPTYQDGPYAIENRLVRAADGAVREVRTVLLDSVQSQANRMELALLRGYRQGKLKFPLLVVDFAQSEQDPLIREIGQVTALEAPHRVADAILRDSLYEGQEFRRSLGRCLDGVRAANATSLFSLCPTALIFGMWDSTGPKGGLGAKFARLLVSEIVGFGAIDGVRPAGRIDPLQIENIEGIGAPIYRTPDGSWSFEEKDAARDKKGKPITLKPSKINHGNIPPALKDENGVPHHGGVTITHAVQTTVFSLAGLRRLCFPLNGSSRPEADLAARTTLAALALAAICFQEEDGYDLRSRCLLDGAPGPFEFIGQGQTEPFSLTADQAAALLAEAAQDAQRLGLEWPVEPRVLVPTERLKKLIRESRKKTMAVSED